MRTGDVHFYPVVVVLTVMRVIALKLRRGLHVI